jgi:hypothetical protein
LLFALALVLDTENAKNVGENPMENENFLCVVFFFEKEPASERALGSAVVFSLPTFSPLFSPMAFRESAPNPEENPKYLDGGSFRK